MAPTTPHARNWKLPFFAIWVGQAFSLFGRPVQFALVWWLTAETGSATGGHGQPGGHVAAGGARPLCRRVGGPVGAAGR